MYLEIAFLIVALLLLCILSYEHYVLSKNRTFNNNNYEDFLSLLTTQDKAPLLVTYYPDKSYYNVYYQGYFVGFDDKKVLSVFPHPVKTPVIEIDRLYADINHLRSMAEDIPMESNTVFTKS